jgi:hypothetical protein
VHGVEPVCGWVGGWVGAPLLMDLLAAVHDVSEVVRRLATNRGVCNSGSSSSGTGGSSGAGDHANEGGRPGWVVGLLTAGSCPQHLAPSCCSTEPSCSSQCTRAGARQVVSHVLRVSQAAAQQLRLTQAHTRPARELVRLPDAHMLPAKLFECRTCWAPARLLQWRQLRLTHT